MDRYNRKPSSIEYDHEWEGGSGPLVMGRASYERTSTPAVEPRESLHDEANSDLGNTGRDFSRSVGEGY